MRDYDSEDTLRRIERERRRAELRRIRRRRAKIKRILMLAGVGICFFLVLILISTVLKGRADASERKMISGGAMEFRMFPDIAEQTSLQSTEEYKDQEEPEEELPFASGYKAKATESTRGIGGEDVLSTYALLIDLDDNTITAQKSAKDRMNPASMTKILTVLVAAEHITDLDDTFTITREITDYSYKNDCSSAGFLDGETVTVKDLLYGTVLPSGGDAAAGLACYVAGSLEKFVELMNEKISELGLSESSHFTNCVGLYDKDHYCTAYDMAMMLKAAVENKLCREVLSAHTYTTSPTEQHPEGIQLSNWFLRRIEDKDTGGEVVCAKTGYVAQSGSCAASYEVTEGGKHYICVTADAYSSWRCIYDHVALYQNYTR